MADWKTGEALPESNWLWRRVVTFVVITVALYLAWATADYQLELIRTAVWSVTQATEDKSGFSLQRMAHAVAVLNQIVPSAQETLHDHNTYAWWTTMCALILYMAAPSIEKLAQAFVAMASIRAGVASTVETVQTTIANATGATTVTDTTQTQTPTTDTTKV